MSFMQTVSFALAGSSDSCSVDISTVDLNIWVEETMRYELREQSSLSSSRHVRILCQSIEVSNASLQVQIQTYHISADDNNQRACYIG